MPSSWEGKPDSEPEAVERGRGYDDEIEGFQVYGDNCLQRLHYKDHQREFVSEKNTFQNRPFILKIKIRSG